MADPEQCELHAAAIAGPSTEAEAFQRLIHSPIGDECQHCPVCRTAQEFVETRLAERAGRVLPPDRNGEATWRKLRAAIESVRTTAHKTT